MSGVALLFLGVGLALPVQAEISVIGRIHLDTAVHDNDDTDFSGAVLLRRAQLGVQGLLEGGWAYKSDWGFAGDVVSAQDVYLQYTGAGPGALTLGQFKVPFGLNELTGSNNIPLIERSMVNEAFSPGRQLGLGYARFGQRGGYQLMGFTRNLNDKIEGDQPVGVAARVVFNPVRQADRMLHLALAANHQGTDDDDEARFRARPEARPGTARLVDTGENDPDGISAAESVTRAGLEAAWQQGPLSLEAEYMRADVRVDDDSDLVFYGFHVQGSYVLTGESRAYGGGRFGGITPAGAGGAWQLVARHSRLDLNDGGIEGGEQANTTLGLNYYASRNVRFMANYILVDQKDSGQKPRIALMRAQVSF